MSRARLVKPTAPQPCDVYFRMHPGFKLISTLPLAWLANKWRGMDAHCCHATYKHMAMAGATGSEITISGLSSMLDHQSKEGIYTGCEVPTLLTANVFIFHLLLPITLSSRRYYPLTFARSIEPFLSSIFIQLVKVQSIWY